MAKKKSKKADFQKVKLKVGRSLPKGLNVTQTKFKTKKIKVPGQYKPASSELRVHRHQTIGDLLKKAQHTSVSVRHEAFLDIHRLLTPHKDLIESNLPALLQVTASGFHDDASSIRNEVVNILCLILENVSELKISAFSSVLLPHLCCAMTSIRHDVRIDSLKALDLCLDAVPSVIISSEKILKNLVSQISFDKNQLIVCDKSGFRVSNMSLKTASERVKSHNWRANVLHTLAKFLKAVNVQFSKKEIGYFWPTFYSPIKIPGMGIKVTEFSDLENYITDLMPILFDIWIEAAPVPYAKIDSGEVVSAEAANIMDHVLQVVRLICEWIKVIDEKNKNTDKIMWFNQKYRKQIFGRLMVWFPFSQRVSAGKRKRHADTEMSCLAVNLAICDVFSMMPQATSNVCSKLYEKTTGYLLDVINSDNNGGVASVSAIVKILRQLLTTSKLEYFESHLNGLLKRYKEFEEGKKEKETFLNFITDLILDIRNKEFLENLPMMKHLVQSLLRDLIIMHQRKHVEKHTLDIVRQLNVIGFVPFVTELQEKYLILIELIQSEEVEIQKTAVYLTSRLTHIPLEFFCQLTKAIFNPAVQVNTVVQLLATLSLGLRRPLHIPAFTGKDYANFLFGVAVGMFKHETDKYMNAAHVQQDKFKDIIPFHMSEYAVAESCNLQRHFDITQAAIKSLMGFSDKKQVAQCIHTFVVQFTTHCASFPVHSGLAILLLEVEAYKAGEMTQDVDCLLCITEVTIALFIYQIAWEQDRDPAEIPSGSIMGALLTIVKTLNNMKHVCDIIRSRIRDMQNLDQAQCIGRLMLIVLRKRLLKPEDLREFLRVMSELHEQFGDNILDEPWWHSINHEINLPPYCGE